MDVGQALNYVVTFVSVLMWLVNAASFVLNTLSKMLLALICIACMAIVTYAGMLRVLFYLLSPCKISPRLFLPFL